MNAYLKTFLVASIGVALVSVAIQVVTIQYSSEISKVLHAYPSLNMTSETLKSAFPIQKLLLSLNKYFPSIRNLPFLQPVPESSASTKSKKVKEKLFTSEQLKKFDGKDESKGPYLSILGRVYNVRKGKKHYGPGGGYEFFSGRDASRSFVSGDFSEAGLVDDVSGLSGSDYIGLDEWVKFYDSDYKYIGKLIGRYYDKNGEPTPFYYETQKWISEAYAKKEKDNVEKKIFPPCNSEWNPESGSRLWCTKRSGGIERDWVGVPRKLFIPGQSNSRCACVKNFGPPSHDPKRVTHNDRGDLDHPNLQEYANCAPHQPECFVKTD
ncbi:neuferricin-like [Eriocheir sinensis]|uniref:neuferricin-like n=1 Tax=Eriocheir sinensis TaxID=95602 RepID=UPI0021C5A2A4|nr:neuferricin-like [Eriocheir sinensis]